MKENQNKTQKNKSINKEIFSIILQDLAKIGEKNKKQLTQVKSHDIMCLSNDRTIERRQQCLVSIGMKKQKQ